MAVIDIYNSACGAIGTRSKFATVNDAGTEMEACNLYYDRVRKLILCAAHWTFATGAAKLVAAVERDPNVAWAVTDPLPGWLYSYTVPVDMLYPQHMSDFSQFVVTQSSSNVKRINSNTETAIFIYTKDQTNPTTWDPPFESALVFGLAALICVKITGKHERMKLMEEKANQLILQARLADANVNNQVSDWIAPWHVARGFEGGSETRYIHPYGPLINAAYF